jgi:hypothetical protein
MATSPVSVNLMDCQRDFGTQRAVRKSPAPAADFHFSDSGSGERWLSGRTMSPRASDIGGTRPIKRRNAPPKEERNDTLGFTLSFEGEHALSSDHIETLFFQ